MTNLNETAGDDRKEVAEFARYCVGSCFDDWDPRCDLTFDRVMADDEAYEFYRQQHLRYLRWRAEAGRAKGGLGIGLSIREEDEVWPASAADQH